MDFESHRAESTRSIVMALGALLIVTFVIGGVAAGAFQGFAPELLTARAMLERERVRELQLKNDETAEALRHTQAQNAQNEKKMEIALQEKKLWVQLVRQQAAHWSEQLGYAGPWIIVIGFSALVSGILGRLLLREFLAARQQVPANRTADEDLILSSFDPDSVIVSHRQTLAEKQVHAQTRERARQREQFERLWMLKRQEQNRMNGKQRAA